MINNIFYIGYSCTILKNNFVNYLSIITVFPQMIRPIILSQIRWTSTWLLLISMMDSNVFIDNSFSLSWSNMRSTGLSLSWLIWECMSRCTCVGRVPRAYQPTMSHAGTARKRGLGVCVGVACPQPLSYLTPLLFPEAKAKTKYKASIEYCPITGGFHQFKFKRKNTHDLEHFFNQTLVYIIVTDSP